ncbi:MAG: Fur family transcriptional regulator [Anaerolineaceae bacterium]|jgi:Fe2+ or Zn2+ uptake regulation protein
MKMIFIIKWRYITEQEDDAKTTLWLDKLEANGYRLTAPRRAVVRVMAQSHFTLDPTRVFLESRRSCNSLGLVTVYRTLEKLEELRLVQRVHQQDGCHSYVAAGNGHQHLLICSSCNKAEYFSGDDLVPLMKTLGTERGYEIKEHWLQLFGVCSQCQKKSQAPSQI